MSDQQTSARTTILSAWPDHIGPPLRAYFYSGWAFFIPYLLAYLLYAWLKWPANPGSAVEGGLRSVVPSLLTVYWTLHGIHILLATTALASWWREKKGDSPTQPSDRPTVHAGVVRGASSLDILWSVAWRLVPWLCLALIFYIPGVYLEWPSDPWEHLRRINEWHAHSDIMAHSAWRKSSYFYTYTITGYTTGLMQVKLLDAYSTCICLLLCWQNYRLARAIGLGERASIAFAVVNVFTFGNNVFSFFRYYSLSSTVFAQIGAVALTRIILDIVDSSGPARALLLSSRSPLLRSMASASALFPLIAFNHPQGIGIAGLSGTAVLAWRLVAWRQSTIWWILGALVAASIGVALWYPRDAVLFEYYRAHNWLSPVLGLDIFDPTSPACDRAIQILGFFGILNLAACPWLIARNHIAAWLSLAPLILLALPCVAIPLAQQLGSNNEGRSIVAFHRMLLAVPVGLAFVTVISSCFPAARNKSLARSSASQQKPLYALAEPPNSLSSDVRRAHATLFAPAAMLLAVAAVPAQSPWYARLWHTLQVSSEDLQLQHLLPVVGNRPDEDTIVLDAPLESEIHEAFVPSPYWYIFRDPLASLNDAKLRQRLAWLDAASLRFDDGPTREVGGDAQDREYIVGIRTTSDSSHPTTIDLMTSEKDWIQLGGHPAETKYDDGRLVLSTKGRCSYPFSRELIPIFRDRHYELTSTIRQPDDRKAINYLGVAWYDKDGRLLHSSLPPPQGTGDPVGWINGTYSYYQLAGRAAPPVQTRYTISFGLGEPAEIPANAAFIRVGALLNYRNTPGAVVELSGAVLTVLGDYNRLAFRAPPYRQLTTPRSQSAQLSGHWPPQQVIVAHAGIAELRERLANAVKSSGRQPEL